MESRGFVKILISLLICLLLLSPLRQVVALQGFRTRIDDIDSAKFPQVDAYLSISDANGLPIKGLSQDAFVVTEDGQPVTIQSFDAIQNREQPLSVALIIDTSMSMRGTSESSPMQKAIEAAAVFSQQLSPKDWVAVISFSDAPKVILPLTSDKTQVAQAIKSLKPEGQQTALYDAVIEGIETLESQSGRRIMVLITDGKNKGGIFKSDDVMKRLSEASIPIYPMGFGGVISVAELQKMAEISGGSAKILPSELELSKSFEELLSVLREQYRIRYISPLPADDKQHELRIMVNYGGGESAAFNMFIGKSSAIPISLPNMQPHQIVGGLVNFAPLIDWPSAIVKSVDIYADGTPLSIIKSPAEESVYGWNAFTSGISIGEHNFVVKVSDVGGNTGQESIVLNVQPPIIMEILSPQNGESVSGGSKITVKVSTLPDVKIGKISFFVDNVEMTSLPGDPAKTEYAADWNAKDSRQYPIKIVAHDASGLFIVETKNIYVNVQPGGGGMIIVILVILFASLSIPFALRARKRGKVSAYGAAVAPYAGAKTLYELDGLNPGKIWSLRNSDIKLGRKRDENDIPLKGLSASRYHAVIRWEQGQYFVYTLNPENPVFVNQVSVAQKQALKLGDVVQLGETTLRLD